VDNGAVISAGKLLILGGPSRLFNMARISLAKLVGLLFIAASADISVG